MASFYQFRLKAGVEFQAPVSGKLILVDDIGGADGIDITPMIANAAGRTMPMRKKAFKCWTDYDALVLRAPVDCTVGMFLSDKDVSLGFADGALVNVVGEVTVGNDPAARVPVEIGGSTVQVTADNVGINNTDDKPVPVKIGNANDKPVPVRVVLLSNLVHKPAVAVAAGAAQSAVNDAAARCLRFYNASADAVIALGGQDVTLANAAIMLQPGDTFVEDNAPGAAWFAAADKAGADLRVMVLK